MVPPNKVRLLRNLPHGHTLMPKHSTLANASSLPSNTKFQRDADKILVGEGFIYERQTAKTANRYVHPDGRVLTVSATPRNPSNAMTLLKQKLRNADVHLIRQGKEAMPTKSTVDPTAPLVSMADSFLLREHDGSREAVQARAHAFNGWVKRVLERHGPMPSTQLEDAAAKIGFTRHQVAKARKALNVSAWRQGLSGGSGAGHWVVGLPHQIPENKMVYGELRERPDNGVAVVSEDAALEPVDTLAVTDSTGDGSELFAAPEEPPSPSLDEPIAVFSSRGEQALAELKRAGEARELDRAAIPFASNDAQAAALILLETLGVKMPGDEARLELRSAMAACREAATAASRAATACERALQAFKQ